VEWFDKAIRTLTPVYQKDPRAFRAALFLRWSHRSRARAHDRLGKYDLADRDWDKAVEMTPEPARLEFRATRAYNRAQDGRLDRAVAEAAELTRAANWNGPDWYNFACIYAIASPKVAGKQREYSDRAMELLHQAVKAGFRDAAHMATDSDLDALRDRDDFQKLLAGLGASPPPKPQRAPMPREVKP
jgi:tetratricopeptide (TPR) repeat protein